MLGTRTTKTSDLRNEINTSIVMTNMNYVMYQLFYGCLITSLCSKSSVSLKKFVSRVLAYVNLGMTQLERPTGLCDISQNTGR